MRRILLWLLLFALLPLSGCRAKTKEYNDPYNRSAAVAYADRYAKQRNPDYADFQNNCTNYISQVLVAGGKKMDAPIQPKKDQRISYHGQRSGWFSTYIESEPERWREFSVSTPFCRTDDFVDYWTNTRGMSLNRYNNNVGGLKKLYQEAEIGDVVILYGPDGGVAHLCVLVVKEGLQLLVNANTNDYYHYNIMKISPQAYPEIGLMQME